MSRLPVRLTVAAVLLAGTAREASAFVLIGVEWPARSVGYRVNANFPDTARAGTAAEQLEIIRCAAKAWRDQTRARFEFLYQGTTTKTTFNENDGVNIVAWSSADGGDALAATLIAGDGAVATSFDILFFNKTGGTTNNWSGPGEPASGEFDIGGVAVHELGHALGLDHTPIAAATMFASASGRALGLRTLHSDDRDGAESIYGTRTQQAPAPQITSVTPADGPTTGGNEVLLEGINFTYDSDTQLLIAGSAVNSTRWDVESCSRLRITDMPSHLAGAADIKVVNTIGLFTLVGGYHYGGPPPRLLSVDPSEGPGAGGILVTILGENLAEGAVITIDGKPLLEPEILGPTSIRGVLPASTAEGPVEVKLEQGVEVSLLPDGFTYNPYFLRVADTQGAAGQTSLPVEIQATSPVPLTSMSFAIAYPQALLAVREVSLAGTAAEPAEFAAANIQNDTGITTVGIVMDLDQPTPSFPAGVDLPMAHVLVDIAPSAAVGIQIDVTIEDGVGTPPIQLIFIKVGSSTNIRPLTKDGRITVIPGVTFLRGDANGDQRRDISDAVFVLEFLFRGGPDGRCDDAADTNDDGQSDISDAITLLQFLFQGWASLPAPFPFAGVDPTADTLGCEG